MRARWSEGVRRAAATAYAASHGTEPPEPRPTRWRLDARTAATAAAVLALLGVLAWWGLRGAEVTALVPTASPGAAASPGATPEVAATAPAEPLAVVHVSGAVAEPGLVSVAAGGRVVDAVAGAGGLAPEADESSVNLARPVIDGEHIIVAALGEDGAPAAGGGAEGAPVSLSSADAAALETLPGIGPVLAARIVADREANGPFLTLDDLARVSGVGPALVAGIAELAIP